MPKNAKSKLTPQMNKFCEEYVVDFNGTKAATRAKYSEKTARSKASQLLTNVNIQNRIAELLKKQSSKTEVTVERIKKQLAKIGFGGKKTHTEVRALELLGKHKGMFLDKIEHSTPDGKPLEVGVVMLPPKVGGA